MYGGNKKFADFSEFINEQILPTAPTNISRPTIRNTKEREHYSACYNRTGKC